jgi:hypothetical protein
MKASTSLVLVVALLTSLALPSTYAQAPAAAPPAVPPAQFTLAIQKLGVEAIRAKQTRIAGGDYDDKNERITFNVKLTNPDIKIPLNDLKAEFYVFAQEIVDRRVFRLLGKDESPFSLPPRGTHTFTTAEVVTMYDTTDARFGYRYSGWALVIRDSAGKIVFKKATTPNWASGAEQLSLLTPGNAFDRDLKPVRSAGGTRSLVR